MFCIDDKKIEITEQKVFVGDYIREGSNGYNLCISLKFFNSDTGESGYLNLDVGFDSQNSIDYFTNKEYRGVPFYIDNKNDIFLELFDTEKFLDTEIEGEIIVNVLTIENDKLKVMFEVNDELIKIMYDGYLDIES